MNRKIVTILLLPFLLTACDKEMTREELKEIIINFSDEENIKPLRKDSRTSNFTYEYELLQTNPDNKITWSVKHDRIYDRDNGVFIEKHYNLFESSDLIDTVTYNVIRTDNDGMTYLFTYIENKVVENDNKYSKITFDSFEQARTFLEVKTYTLLKQYENSAISTATRLYKTFKSDESKVSGISRKDLKFINFTDYNDVFEEEQHSSIIYDVNSNEITEIIDDYSSEEGTMHYRDSIDFRIGSYSLPDFSNFVLSEESLF